MLPSSIRYWLFDTLSVQTMRYVTAVPTRQADGLTKEVYDMIREDFFKNGSLTSRSRVPVLMAAIWTGGRESMLVADKVDRTTKDAISAVLSQINDCPYCEDMLISLVHAGGEHDAATDILRRADFGAADDELRRRLEWVRGSGALLVRGGSSGRRRRHPDLARAALTHGCSPTPCLASSRRNPL